MSYGRPGIYLNESLSTVAAPIAEAPTANAAGAVLAVFAKGPDTLTKVTSWFDFVRLFGGYDANYPATFGVGQFFLNGGSELYVKRVLHSDAATASVSVTRAVGSGTVATVTAKAKGADGNNLRVQLKAAKTANYYDLFIYLEGVAGTASNVTNDTLLETFRNVRFDQPSSSDYVANVVSLESAFVSITVADNTHAPLAAIYPLVSGSDGTAPVASDYTAQLATDGTSPFDSVARPLVIFSPEIVKILGATNGATVQSALTAWAGVNNGFAVLDTASGLAPADAITYVSGLTASAYGAVYYPNVYIQDPIGRSTRSIRLIGPAGAVAGSFIATDKSDGPFKAPAGIQNSLEGVVALERSPSPAELDALNSADLPVNAIRNLPGAGFVVMGARTLLQDGSPNRYVNMRRSLDYLEQNFENLTQFALFENNDTHLWAKVHATLTYFLQLYKNAGGLRGASFAQAFYVKCDASNNTANSIANGELHVEVGVALEYPAEFVVINLTQKAAA
jgi:hypothetical protein